MLSTRPLFRSAIAFAPLAIFAVFGGLTACKPVDLSDVNTTPTPKDSAATATLRITNKIDVDADSLVFLLFPGASTDFTTAANSQVIGGVGIGATGTFKVPAGTWKLAYENGAQEITALRAGGADEWVKAIFEKDGDYSLILTSDTHTIYWDPTFKTDPPL
ncbi:MAG: hypothetical protein JF616_16550 [Fibrobacteres bacterium]|nr:hypothetical protein [Fibrobacterota bacterium]